MGKGYRIWSVPLIMLMWDVTFRTGGDVTVAAVVKDVITRPWFLVISGWLIILGVAMDYRGKLLVKALQNTEDLAHISHIMLEHNRFADLMIISPVVYYVAKAMGVIASGGSILTLSFIADIHGALTLIAVFDGLKSVNGNIHIRQELEF